MITDNIPMVVGSIMAKFSELSNPETISRAAALAVMPELRHRIHVEGKKTDGSPIGIYDNAYLRIRQKKYNRTSDTEVIASLTRQLENSYVLQATEKGYTIGVSTPRSIEKIQWLTEKYGIIWQLSEGELNMAKIAATETAKQLLQ